MYFNRVGATKYGIIFSAPLFIYGVKIYPSYFALHTLDDQDSWHHRAKTGKLYQSGCNPCAAIVSASYL
jgi:hypothetical protein